MTVTIGARAPADLQIDELAPADLPGAAPALGDVLHACVLDGASVGFVLPLDPAHAQAFWLAQQAALDAGDKRILVARQNGQIVGTATVILGMPPNGRLRGEIAKVLVHPAARRQGLAAALMRAAESLARAAGKRTLVLDTAGAAAEALYRGLGWQEAGRIPAYALNVHGVPEPTLYMYKELPADVAT